MPRAYVKENIVCEGCGAKIITDGRLTCPRCHESIQIASSKDVARDEEGRWKCQKCLEHGKNPKTLAIGDEIQCRVCPEKTKNRLFKEESEVTKAAVQEKSGPTKLTTKEYNELLQQWLKHEKKKKREIEKIPPVIIISPAGERDTVREEIEAINKRIEALEKAIALGFDPDEFERTLNVPLRVRVMYMLGQEQYQNIIFEALIRVHARGIRDELKKITFYPLSRTLLLQSMKEEGEPVVYDNWSSEIHGVEEVVYKDQGSPHYVRFRKGTRLIFVCFDGVVQDRDGNY